MELNHKKLTTVYPFIEFQLDREISKCETLSQVGRGCQKGCASCCKTQRIFINPTEAGSILSYLESQNNSSIRASVISKLTNIKPTSDKLSPGPNTPCVFLDRNDSCTIYDVRPFQCRAYVSPDKNQCITWESNGHNGVKPGFSAWSKSVLIMAKTYSKEYCGENYEIGEINSTIKMFYFDWSSVQLANFIE